MERYERENLSVNKDYMSIVWIGRAYTSISWMD